MNIKIILCFQIIKLELYNYKVFLKYRLNTIAINSIFEIIVRIKLIIKLISLSIVFYSNDSKYK